MIPNRNIVILGMPGDEHAEYMIEELHHAGATVWLLDTSDFPDRLQVSFDPAKGTGHFIFKDEMCLNFKDIHSVYWRNFGDTSLRTKHHVTDPEQLHIAENDSRSLFESLLLSLPCKWVNGWEGFQMHQRKPAALARIAATGVQVPKTICSNSAEALLGFANEVGTFIFKPIQGGAYTRTLTKAELTEERLSRLQLAPITLQERIFGTNIRVFVAGNTVLACEIHTEELDFREDQKVKMTPLTLKPEFQSLCRSIADKLHLKWSGMDFIRDKNGEMFFLEANPSPMFMGFETLTGLPLKQSLVNLLLD